MNEEIPQTGGAAPDNLIDLINQLIQPPPPDPVTMTPQTWGWVVLAGLLALVLCGALWRWLAHRRANAYRRAALFQLQNAATTAEVAVILRRAALAAYPRAQVAGLTGPAWTAFLTDSGKATFPEAEATELTRAPYRDETAAPSPALIAAAGHWLRSHRPPAADKRRRLARIRPSLRRATSARSGGRA
ncbi:DUF4381 domain-containing protein [Pseudooceanicola algae]|uniref:DUF4381 domain-containing protein n=1 Tax=Pseudooceanicola algae TaxID=1537215 RepID=A0A418SIB2_9RHOB|nr:DUF4381 domain-containing protein [Pseudooceanicola algae]QPM88993.1 hypothetical protein PSAL_001960 [Pseudooceanicola algae]